MAPRVNAARLEADRGCFTRSPRPLRRPGLDEERLLCTWGVWHARDSAPASLSLHSIALVEFKRDGDGAQRTDASAGLVDPVRRRLDAEPGDGHAPEPRPVPAADD